MIKKKNSKQNSARNGVQNTSCSLVQSRGYKFFVFLLDGLLSSMGYKWGPKATQPLNNTLKAVVLGAFLELVIHLRHLHKGLTYIV